MKQQTRLIDELKEIPCYGKTLEKITNEADIIYHCPFHAGQKFREDLIEIGYDYSMLDLKTLSKSKKRSYSTSVILEWSPSLSFSNELRSSGKIHDKFVKGTRIVYIHCNAFTGWLLKNGLRFQRKRNHD